MELIRIAEDEGVICVLQAMSVCHIILSSISSNQEIWACLFQYACQDVHRDDE